MSTEKQITANRLNAQKSTGPRTEEGRAAVRLNAVRHGLCAETIVLPGEDKAEFQALFDDLEATHKPANRSEVILVRQMAMAAWRLDRAWHVEGALYAYELDASAGMRDKYHGGLDHHGKLAYMVRDSSNGATLSNLARYEAHLQRCYRQALRDLTRLQAARKAEEARQSEQSIPKIGSVSQISKQPIPIKQIINLDQIPSPAPPTLPPSLPARGRLEPDDARPNQSHDAESS